MELYVFSFLWILMGFVAPAKFLGWVAPILTEEQEPLTLGKRYLLFNMSVLSLCIIVIAFYFTMLMIGG